MVPTTNTTPIKVAWEKVYPALYYQLTLTIIGSKLWPYIIPGAEWAVDKTIKDFQNIVCLKFWYRELNRLTENTVSWVLQKKQRLYSETI